MNKLYGYTIQTIDRSSAQLSKISGSMVRLEQTTKAVEQRQRQLSEQEKKTVKSLQEAQIAAKATTGNLKDLASAIDLLKQKRDLLPQSEVKKLKDANAEIHRMEQRLGKLQSHKASVDLRTAAGWKTVAGDAAGQLTGFGGLGSAALASAGIVGVGYAMNNAVQKALEFEKVMAKVNTTAELGDARFAALKRTVEAAGQGFFSAAETAQAFEVLLSATNDLQKSQQALPAVIRAAKAGFTDPATAARATAFMMNSTGMDATTTLDMLFAAKRAGSGEFADFANNLPQVVSQGKAYGMQPRDVTGVYTMFTRLVDASTSAMLTSNLMTSLSKREVQKRMEGAGIGLYGADNQMLPLPVIVRSVAAAMQTGRKAQVLDALGLHDSQANAAYGALSSNLKDLDSVVKEVNGSLGSMDRALRFSSNSNDEFTRTMLAFDNQMRRLGEKLLPGIVSALSAMNSMLAKYFPSTEERFKNSGLYSSLSDSTKARLEQINNGTYGAAAKVASKPKAAMPTSGLTGIGKIANELSSVGGDRGVSGGKSFTIEKLNINVTAPNIDMAADEVAKRMLEMFNRVGTQIVNQSSTN